MEILEKVFNIFFIYGKRIFFVYVYGVSLYRMVRDW